MVTDALRTPHLTRASDIQLKGVFDISNGEEILWRVKVFFLGGGFRLVQFRLFVIVNLTNENLEVPIRVLP